MEHFKLLIFDLDGTVIDSLKDIALAVNYVRTSYNLPKAKLSDIKSFIGDGAKVLLQKSISHLNENEVQKNILKYNNYYRKHLLDNTVLYPGMKKVIQFFHNKDKVILSNKSEEFSKKIIDRLDASQYFQFVYGGDSYKKCKPDPEPIKNIMKQFKVGKKDTVIIGDGVNDILAAKAAGIKSIAVGYGYSQKEILKKLNPDYFVDRAEDILKIIHSKDKGR